MKGVFVYMQLMGMSPFTFSQTVKRIHGHAVPQAAYATRLIGKTLRCWDAVVRITRPVYRDMPLAVYAYPVVGKRVLVDTNRHVHWEQVRPDVVKAIDIARHATVGVGK